MKDPLQAIKVVSWQCIIIGSFMAIKIPETIIQLFVMSQFDPAYAESFFPGLILFSFGASFAWLALSILSLSIILLISGYYLLQKKSWARNVLEIVFWFLLVFIVFNIGRIVLTILSDVSSLSVVGSIYGITLIPFLFIGALLIFNLVLLRNKKVKRVLS